jgi:UDP-3-O-[3-hydroxymyristoyl] glucosamine N-acyltransferase
VNSSPPPNPAPGAPLPLGLIAELLSLRLEGDPALLISGVATIEEAAAGELTFLSNPKYARFLQTTRAAAVILGEGVERPPALTALISPHPYLSFAHALALFHPSPPRPLGIDPRAVIAPSAVIGPGAAIGPFTLIGAGARIGRGVTIHAHCQIYAGAEIGDESVIHSHCAVRERCRLGRRVILQNGAVIGSDGFGYAPRPDQSWHKIPQTGIVILEDEVEVGAGSVIDRATIGATRIRAGAKIDNLVQIGHGSTVGRQTLLCAQVGLAGSTRVGDHVILSGQVGAAGHLEIGDRVVATAQTGIPHSVPAGSIISGYPAIDNRQWLRSSAIFARLPDLQREVRRLRTRLEALEAALEAAPDDSPAGSPEA